MTPSKPSLKGSTPAMQTVSVGARRFPDRSRRSVVFPAPFALHVDYRLGSGSYPKKEKKYIFSFGLREGVERGDEYHQLGEYGFQVGGPIQRL